MKKSLYCLFILLFFASCASSTKLTDKGRNVLVVDDRPGHECEVVGKVVGENDFGSIEVAKNMARNKAGKLDATHLFITDKVMNGNNWTIHALAYQCQ